jgi:hypothetical protein
MTGLEMRDVGSRPPGVPVRRGPGLNAGRSVLASDIPIQHSDAIEEVAGPA